MRPSASSSPATPWAAGWRSTSPWPVRTAWRRSSSSGPRRASPTRSSARPGAPRTRRWPRRSRSRRWRRSPRAGGRNPLLGGAARGGPGGARGPPAQPPGGPCRGARGLGPGACEPVWGRLGELRMPVTLVVGERDARYRKLGERMTAAMPEARTSSSRPPASGPRRGARDRGAGDRPGRIGPGPAVLKRVMPKNRVLPAAAAAVASSRWCSRPWRAPSSGGSQPEARRPRPLPSPPPTSRPAGSSASG